MTHPACPICKKPRKEAFKPFCSKRCAAVDLGRWFAGAYAIPARPDESEDGDAVPTQSRDDD
jgi:endogenous inhibitor of DNA gyrase (YacG/DUF329 family)